jgi:2-polyprenyl-3-methyl-5-hydroxy-6-metoxy-1,4-benzoquinol methylase
MKIAAVPEGLIESLASAVGMAPTPVVDTFHAVVIARAIVTGVKLGIFDALAAGPLAVSDLAAKLGLNAGALTKLANLLVATRYLAFDTGRYGLTRKSRKWLLAGNRNSLRDNLLLRLLEWQAIDQTEAFVRTGKALDVHGLISGNQWETYQRGMRSLARFSAGEVARRVKLAAGATAMLDIGGGHGTYSVAFCKAHPNLQATILDLPEAVATSAPLLVEETMGARVVHRSGDALTTDLGRDLYDLIFISHLIHHFDSAQNTAVIARAATALKPGGTLAVLDVLRPTAPQKTSQTGAMLDLYFALTSNAGTWPAEEIIGWGVNAGLRPGKNMNLVTAPGIAVLTLTKPARAA